MRQLPCVVHAVGVAIAVGSLGVRPARSRRGGEPVVRFVAEFVGCFALQRKPGAIGIAWPRFAVVVRHVFHRQIRHEPGVLVAETLRVIGLQQAHRLAAVGQAAIERPNNCHAAWHVVMLAEPRRNHRLGNGIKTDDQLITAGRQGCICREVQFHAASNPPRVLRLNRIEQRHGLFAEVVQLDVFELRRAKVIDVRLALVHDFADDDRADLWLGVGRSPTLAERDNRLGRIIAECASGQRHEMRAKTGCDAAGRDAVGHRRNRLHGAKYAWFTARADS